MFSNTEYFFLVERIQNSGLLEMWEYFQKLMEMKLKGKFIFVGKRFLKIIYMHIYYTYNF